MAWSGRALETQKGLAVDCSGTTSHHQIIDAEYNKETGATVLHYSVFYAPVDFRLRTSEIPDDFVNRMCCKTPDSPDKKVELEAYYQRFLKSIRSYNKSHAFRLGEYAKALTYDLTFDHTCNLEKFDVRPTLAKMNKALDYNHADAEAFREKPDQTLRLWHDTIATTCGIRKGRIGFGHVTNCTTDLIQKNLVSMARDNGVDLVYRIDPRAAWYNGEELDEVMQMSLQDKMNRFSPRYGSVMKAESRKENPIKGNDRTRVPSTASRNDVDFFNVACVWEFLNNFGQNKFPQGTALAVANYKRHISTWQYLGLLKAA